MPKSRASRQRAVYILLYQLEPPRSNQQLTVTEPNSSSRASCRSRVMTASPASYTHAGIPFSFSVAVRIILTSHLNSCHYSVRLLEVVRDGGDSSVGSAIVSFIAHFLEFTLPCPIPLTKLRILHLHIVITEILRLRKYCEQSAS
jgi:hypothetical protein